MCKYGWCVVLVAGLCPAARGEDDERPPWGDHPPSYTAVIDVGRILREHPRPREFPGLRDAELKLEAEESRWNEALPVRQAELASRRAALSRLDPASARWRKASDSLRVDEQALTAEDNAQRADFAQRREALQAAILGEIRKHIDAFAKKHKIAIVLNRADHDPEVGDAAAMKLLFERDVVYDNRIDITFDILDAMKPPRRK